MTVVAALIWAPRDPRGLKATLNSVEAAADVARRAGIAVELVLLSERGCAWTRSVLRTFASPLRQDEYRPGTDPAVVKMRAIRAARRARFISIIEAGDLISSDWLAQGAAVLRRAKRARTVVHPETTILFGPSRKFRRLTSPARAGAKFPAAKLAWCTLWGPAILAPRALLLAQPLPRRARGFSHEYRWWCCETLARGVVHRAVPSTALFVREGSAGARELLDRGLGSPMRPTLLLEEGAAATEVSGRVPADGARPDSLVRDWRTLQAFEPELQFPPGEGPEVSEVDVDCDGLAAVHARLVRALPRELDYLFIIHQLRKGGSELEALLHVRAIRAHRPRSRIAFLTTEAVDSDWRERLPADVKVIEFAALAGQYLPPAEQPRLLQRLLLQARPRRIHLKHSWQGWEVFRESWTALASQSRLFSSFYCVEPDLAGVPTSFAYTHLPACAPGLSSVFCDNARLTSHLRDVLGISGVRTLYFPVSVPSRPLRSARAASGEPRSLRILWASRLARQKRPELLVEIAARLPDDEFHLYGEFSENHGWNEFRDSLLRHPNLVFHGGFDGLDSIDTSGFDLFLYTSAWDGLPNILLEAGAHGLPIVASQVGGVPEVIDEDTGFLAESAEDFVRQIQRIRVNDGEALRRCQVLQARLAERHDFPSFLKRLREVPSYL